MPIPVPRSVQGAEAQRILRLFPSYRDFIDDSLFHPSWGYYSTGAVRFGEGGHYDTFPIALSPYFGHMVARYAFRRWRAAGMPQEFEIGELGAGNGQLALDTVLAIERPLRKVRSWERFAAVTRYRIIERSPALIERQRQTLGPLARRVRWLRADLSQRSPQGGPLAAHGLLIANEVLDCLARHKIVPHADGGPGVVCVVPRLGRRGRTVPRAQLAHVMTSPKLRAQVQFEEVVLPLVLQPRLQVFLREHYPELFRRRKFPPYFACPEEAALIANAAGLYTNADAVWIDYGGDRGYHLRSCETRKVFAGPPRSGASVFADPGGNDVTFMVDFSVAASAARRSGWRLVYYGGQRELARRSGVRLAENARKVILEQRTLHWMLAILGIGPEAAWRRHGLTWNRRAARGGKLRDDVDDAVREFLGLQPSWFQMLLLRRGVGT